MIRKWSYLTTSVYDEKLPTWKNNYFMRRFRFLSVRRKTFKMRKKRMSLQILTRIKYTKKFLKKRHCTTSLYFKLFIFKDWSRDYLNSRQFWRFYQSLGSLNTTSSSVSANIASIVCHVDYLNVPINISSISYRNLLSVLNTIRFKNTSVLKKKNIFKESINLLNIYSDKVLLDDLYYKLGAFSLFYENNFYENNFYELLNVNAIVEFKNLLNSIFNLVLYITLAIYQNLLKLTQNIIF